MEDTEVSCKLGIEVLLALLTWSLVLNFEGLSYDHVVERCARNGDPDGKVRLIHELNMGTMLAYS